MVHESIWMVHLSIQKNLHPFNTLAKMFKWFAYGSWYQQASQEFKESDNTFEFVRHFSTELLSSSVNYCTKRWKLNYIVSRTMLIMINSDNKKRGKAWKCEN